MSKTRWSRLDAKTKKLVLKTMILGKIEWGELEILHPKFTFWTNQEKDYFDIDHPLNRDYVVLTEWAMEEIKRVQPK